MADPILGFLVAPVLGQHPMEMMHTLFPRWGIPATIIDRRSHPTLHQFDDPLVLILDRVEQ